jgi:hypothetical protein
MGAKRVLVLVGVLAALLFFSQLLRFENKLTVMYDGENITTTMGAEELKFPYPGAEFNQVSARFQKTVSGENGLRHIKISDGSGNYVFLYSKPVFYLFGKDVFGTMVKGTYKEFNATFGDWSMDNLVSYAMVLHNNTLPQNFTLQADFIGRGYKSLRLWGVKNVTFEIYDGLLGNQFCVSRGRNEFTYCLCPGSECILSYNDKIEPLWWNVKRVLGICAEIGIIVVFIILLVILLSKRSGTNE